jgi:hypothetical protein
LGVGVGVVGLGVGVAVVGLGLGLAVADVLPAAALVAAAEALWDGLAATDAGCS